MDFIRPILLCSTGIDDVRVAKADDETRVVVGGDVEHLAGFGYQLVEHLARVAHDSRAQAESVG